MGHPAGFGEAGERSHPGRCNPHAWLKSGAIQPAKAVSVSPRRDPPPVRFGAALSCVVSRFEMGRDVGLVKSGFRPTGCWVLPPIRPFADSPFTSPTVRYTTLMADGYQSIENHGVIGNLETVALVAIDGTIDFCCFPDFDSPTIFADLLDGDKGGRFSIAAVLQNSRPKQSYLPNTNILLTRFLSPDGVGEVSDFMPVFDGQSASEQERRECSKIVRRAKCVPS